MHSFPAIEGFAVVCQGHEMCIRDSSNVYHWFERVEKGVYRLSEEGRKALEEPDYEKVIEYYRKK